MSCNQNTNMLTTIQKHAPIISILLLIALLATLFFYPAASRVLSTIVIVFGIGTAIILTVQKHWQTYQNTEYTREKMIRNLALDLLGLALTMGAAMYAGRLAGGYFGIRAGLWAGLFAGFAGGFAAAWAVRSVWGRVSGVVA